MKLPHNLSPGEVSITDATLIFAASSIAMVVTNPRLDDNPIVYVNRAFEDLTGYAARTALGRNCRFLQGPGTDPLSLDVIRRDLQAGRDCSVVLRNYRANGEAFYNGLLISPVVNDDGALIYYVGLQSEIGEAEQAQRLERFQGLIAEIQHRVKNHLSMILGLIRIKSATLPDGRGLKDLSRRIESLQLLYEEMSAAGDGQNEDRVQLGAYLGRVANAIAHLDGRPGVRMNIQVEPLVVETEKAVRISLIVSEILTNAMQHAFAGQASGLVELRVTRTDSGGMRAMITDDGVGLPEGIEWPSPNGMGGRIVSGLVEGLGVSLLVTRGAIGTNVTLEVPGWNRISAAEGPWRRLVKVT